MTESFPIEPGARFEINPLYMFRWEETQDAFVLLYPEGIVKLNETAAAILERCDGQATVAEIVADLSRRFGANRAEPGDRIESGVRKFLEVSHAKGWIQRKT